MRPSIDVLHQLLDTYSARQVAPVAGPPDPAVWAQALIEAGQAQGLAITSAEAQATVAEVLARPATPRPLPLALPTTTWSRPTSTAQWHAQRTRAHRAQARNARRTQRLISARDGHPLWLANLAVLLGGGVAMTAAGVHEWATAGIPLVPMGVCVSLIGLCMGLVGEGPLYTARKAWLLRCLARQPRLDAICRQLTPSEPPAQDLARWRQIPALAQSLTALAHSEVPILTLDRDAIRPHLPAPAPARYQAEGHRRGQYTVGG